NRAARVRESGSPLLSTASILETGRGPFLPLRPTTWALVTISPGPGTQNPLPLPTDPSAYNTRRYTVAFFTFASTSRGIRPSAAGADGASLAAGGVAGGVSGFGSDFGGSEFAATCGAGCLVGHST